MARGRPTSSYTYVPTGTERRPRFTMYFMELEAFVRESAHLPSADSAKRTQGAARNIVRQELAKLGENVVVPAFRAAAPVREWTGRSRDPRVRRSAGPRRKLLKDTIRMVRRGNVETDTPQVRIDMGAWGQGTIERRAALGDAGPGHAFRLVLPGGQVIFRRYVGPATVRAFSTGALAPYDGMNRFSGGPGQRKPMNKPVSALSFPPVDSGAATKRMRWAADTWGRIKRSRAIQEVLNNIAIQMLAHNPLYRSIRTVSAQAFADQAARDEYSQWLEDVAAEESRPASAALHAQFNERFRLTRRGIARQHEEVRQAAKAKAREAAKAEQKAKGKTAHDRNRDVAHSAAQEFLHREHQTVETYRQAYNNLATDYNLSLKVPGYKGSAQQEADRGFVLRAKARYETAIKRYDRLHAQYESTR